MTDDAAQFELVDDDNIPRNSFEVVLSPMNHEAFLGVPVATISEIMRKSIVAYTSDNNTLSLNIKSNNMVSVLAFIEAMAASGRKELLIYHYDGQGKRIYTLAVSVHELMDFAISRMKDDDTHGIHNDVPVTLRADVEFRL